MNAAVLHALGEAPRFEQFEDPSPAGDEVIVHVRAAALKPVDKAMADGSHYASFREFPAVCGLDGIGLLEDGKRVLFAGPRRPFGAMAERTVVAQSRCFPVLDGVTDEEAAALFNPGMSAWLTLATRPELVPGENVLVLGATGVTGQLAIQIAKLLGAGRVVGAGRNIDVLNRLRDLGADAVIHLDQPEDELIRAFTRESGRDGYNLILDYLWGRPTELLLSALTRTEFTPAASRLRLIQIGESAGAAINLPAAVLRSSRLEILGAGSGSLPPPDTLNAIREQLMAKAASGELKIETERVPLSRIGQAWNRKQHGRRLVVIP
jgi:NADPH:quinone reductase-like Zn-dependent oxidoreductase